MLDWPDIDYGYDESDFAHEMFNQFIEENFTMASITPIKFVPPGPARLSYVQLFEPAQGPDTTQDPVRSVSLLFPKSDVRCMNVISANLTQIANAAVAAGEANAIAGLKMPARDGDAEVASGNRGKEYAGMIFMNAKSWRPVGIVDGQHGKINIV